MSDKDIDEFLMEDTKTGKIATIRKDGRPHVVPICFIWENRKIYFTTMNTSIKAKNITNNSKVSFCTDEQVTPFSFVIIEGEAKIVENSNLLEYGAKIEQRYMGKKYLKKIQNELLLKDQYWLKLLHQK